MGKNAWQVIADPVNDEEDGPRNLDNVDEKPEKHGTYL